MNNHLLNFLTPVLILIFFVLLGILAGATVVIPWIAYIHFGFIACAFAIALVLGFYNMLYHWLDSKGD